MPVAARGKTHPRIHAAKLLVRIGRQLYRVCPMQRGSRGKSRGWCWWHELFRGSRRFESVVESRFLFGLFSFFSPSSFFLSALDTPGNVCGRVRSRGERCFDHVLTSVSPSLPQPLVLLAPGIFINGVFAKENFSPFLLPFFFTDINYRSLIK